MSKDWILSIDFGTSNTAAAHTNPMRGGVEGVSLSHDRMTMPSSVYIETPDHVDTGDVALNKAEGNPDGFLAAPKRVIPQQIFQINGYDIPASTPVAAVLESVVRKASREHNDHRPTELVLTHPEAWTDAEIKVLLDAASQLGLNATTIKTVSEPKAAAQYYSSSEPLEPGDKIAVFDFGGGTLDVAVLEAQVDGSFHIVAARGDNSLGGKSFDALVRRWVDRELEDDHPDQIEYLRRRAPLSDRHAVEDSIRRAKEVLSESPTATITVPGESESVRLTLTRNEFEDIIRQPVQRAAELTRLTLADASITAPNQLKALYMTGGSSRVPLVQEEIKKLGPVANLDDPKMVVAQGAISAAAPIVSGLHTATAPVTPVGPAGSSRVDNSAYAQPAAPSSAPAEPKKNRTGLIAGAVLGAVVLLGGAGIFAMTRGQDPADDTVETETASTAPASPEAGAQSTEAGPASPATRDEMYEALPQSLKDSVDTCTLLAANESYRDVPVISCRMKPDGEGAEHFKPTSRYSDATVTFAFDQEYAKRERSLIKQGQHTRGESAAEATNDADTAAAASSVTGMGNGATLNYANVDTTMVMSSFDFASPNDAIDWLKMKQLL